MKKNIALIGFMGSGKSTIGRLLAERVGWRYLDLDKEIESRTGNHISQIFEEEGEAAFRDHEMKALERLGGESGMILSCGGGVILRDENKRRLKDNFFVVHLDVPLDQLKERLLRSRHRRPLLEVAEPEQAVDELYRKRESLYRQSADENLTVEENFSAAVNSERLLTLLEPMGFDFNPRRLRVELGDRTYPILIGDGLFERAGDLVRELFPRTDRIIIISDDTVGPLYRDKLSEGLRGAGFKADYVEIGSGEIEKSLEGAARVYGRLIELEIDRRTPLAALGGGVVGDMAGFVASTYMRGVPFIQVPTTLLSQVDSSVGGKTAVNLPQAKNIVGTFYQPKMVLADLDVLTTLPPRELRAGLAEVVKYGFLAGRELIGKIETALEDVLEGQLTALKGIIYDCCAYKAAVVAEDETDQGKRAVLNYGHTIGHAVEAAGEYRTFNHGEAISVGMRGAALIAAKLGFIDEELVELHTRLLRRIGLPVDIAGLNPESVVGRLALDKKRVGESQLMVLLQGAGNPVIVKVDDDLIRETIFELKGG